VDLFPDPGVLPLWRGNVELPGTDKNFGIFFKKNDLGIDSFYQFLIYYTSEPVIRLMGII
jgi:hypothetical protein